MLKRRLGSQDARYRKRIIIFRLEFSWRKKERGRDRRGAEGAAHAVGKKFFSRYWKGRGGREKGDINKSIPLARSPRVTGWPGGSRLPRFFDTGHIAKSNWSIEKQPSFEWA